MENKEFAVLSTLLYSDIFDFPLTEDEIWQFLPSTQKIKKNELKELLMRAKFCQKVSLDYYCMVGREKIATLRKRRELISKVKLKEAEYVARLLSYIPSVLLIGVSGSVAAMNAKKTDDIDLFIITKKKTVFTTRVLVAVILQLLGKRRKRMVRSAPNKICANFIISEEALSFTNRADVYTARELVQFIPLYERENMYMKLLKSNSWVFRLFPNAKDDCTTKKRLLSKRKVTVVDRVSVLFLRLIEPMLKSLQLYYMRPHRSSEVITDSILAFHPVDHRKMTLSRFSRYKMNYIN